jgi:hypothetical protein
MAMGIQYRSALIAARGFYGREFKAISQYTPIIEKQDRFGGPRQVTFTVEFSSNRIIALTAARQCVIDVASGG